ncbi:hypothetical protein [Flavobacterium sp.]|uniref:hypothetical protein n=1 Tax=Flavobacterium sp. TaxID=239 RepID=UPI003D121D35
MKNALIINFSQETVEALNKENYTLCCFLACKSENTSAFTPLCWSVTKSFLKSVVIEWEYNLSAYLSTSEITDNKIIYIPQPEFAKTTSRSRSRSIMGTNYRIAVQQRMLIKNYGEVIVDAENAFETVLIQNDSTTEYTTGLCIYSNNDDQYYGNCAFKTYGGHTIKVAPANKAFLMVSSKDIQNSTVILKSENPGMLIDFTTSNDNSRTVTYDINNGWSSDGQVWGIQYPTGTNLKTLLVSG